MGKKKKHKKYCGWIDDYGDDYFDYDDYYYSYDDLNDDDYNDIDNNIAPAQQIQDLAGCNVPMEMICSPQEDSAVFIGLQSNLDAASFVGIQKEKEGNLIIVGGNGSGKSSGIFMPTLRTFDGAICATDLKGELSEWYEKLFRQGLVKRPYIVFDPTQVEGPAYDPFWWLLEDEETNLVSNIREIAIILIPILPDDHQPFWAEAEQSVFSAALLHYFKCGLSFSEAIIKIVTTTTSALCKEIQDGGDTIENIFIGEIANMKPETLANIDRGLRNKLIPFAVDPYISHAFRGTREGANCFTWEDLNTYNIFFRIPADKMNTWGGAINLMYTQLIHYLERRPDQYSATGKENIQTLLLMDEFPRFGKLEVIADAMATLRSKNVNICLAVQSVAQLDKIYGEYDRRIIFDNCQYQVILRANDAETQKYLCELIGTSMRTQRSVSEHLDDFNETTGYSKQISEIREPTVQPHELATLNDVLLLTPQGSFRIEKFQMQNEEMRSKLLSNSKTLCLNATSYKPTDFHPSGPCTIRLTAKAVPASPILPLTWNEGVKLMSIKERSANADRRALASKQQQMRVERTEQRVQERINQRRNYIIGELVAKYFPEVLAFKPGTKDENAVNFEPLEAFLYVLSTDPELVQDVQAKAEQMVLDDPAGEWRIST